VGIIHYDIKPSNFVLGLDNKTIYLLDFGLSECYLTNKDTNGDCFKVNDNIHRDHDKADEIKGTYQYSSRNVHQGLMGSRRDDLESWIYVLIKLQLGQLPWQYLKKNKDILNAKKKWTAKRLTRTLPIAFFHVLVYIKSLGYKQTPDYGWIRHMLTQCATDNHIYIDDQYDWS